MATKPPPPDHPPSRGPAPGEAEIVRLAKLVTDATACPVVGGFAVILHKCRMPVLDCVNERGMGHTVRDGHGRRNGQ